jgi:hypothetical protein
MQVIREISTASAECRERGALGRRAARLGLALALLLAPASARAVDVPPAGSCPPYAVSPGAGGTTEEDVVPQDFRLGEVIHLDAAERLRNYLPPEVWERRQIFFFEGMALQIGPCHRRYPAPEYFRNATAANAGKSRLDDEGNLIGYGGEGLPFAPDSIPDDAPDAGMKWAWNYRYRFQAAGFRGDFRIRHVTRRGKHVERFEGDIFLLPLHGIPESLAAGDASGNRFAAGGRFEKPGDARGVAWRQFRSEQADRDFARSDEIFVYVPDSRRVRRSAPMSVEGMFMPSYTRGSSVSGGSFTLPDAQVSTPDPSVGVTEHWRRGFVGLLLRPNAYRFRLKRVQDVIAPINSHRLGYPADPDRSYGPSGLSVANDRWDIRRAVVIEGESKLLEQPVRRVTLYVDALTQQPLYFVSRRANGLIQEVGIFVGLYSAHDPLAPKWAGNGDDFGVIVPVAQTFVVAGEGGWLRESYELRSDPPSASDWKRFTSTVKLQQRGR